MSPEARRFAEALLLVQKQRKIVVADPTRCVQWAYSSRNDADLAEASLRSLMDSILASGLQIPLRGRKVEDGIEIVSGARRLAAVRLRIIERTPKSNKTRTLSAGRTIPACTY